MIEDTAEEDLDTTPTWRRFVRVVWLVAAIVALAYAALDRWDEVSTAASRMSPPAVVASSLLGLLGVGVSGMIWRRILTGLGHPLTSRQTVRIFFAGQLGKYLPGSVWPVLAQMELGRDAAVPPRTSAAAVGLFLHVHILTGALLGSLVLAVRNVVPPAWGLVAIPAVALLIPGVMRVGVRTVLRLLKREPVARYPDAATVLRASGWAVLMWTLYGAHLALLLPDGGGDVLVAVGIFAAAWTLGFAFLIAPAGAGAREAVMVGLLATTMSTGAALAVALVSRALLTAADLIWGLVGVGLAARGRQVRDP